MCFLVVCYYFYPGTFVVLGNLSENSHLCLNDASGSVSDALVAECLGKVNTFPRRRQASLEPTRTETVIGVRTGNLLERV